MSIIGNLKSSEKYNEVKKLPPFFSVLTVYIILCFAFLIRHYVLTIFRRNKL